MIRKNRDSKKTAEQIIHEEIMKEGERIDRILGPVTYQEPEDHEVDAEIRALIRDRERLQEQNEAYARAHRHMGQKAPHSFGVLAKAAVFVLIVGVCVAGFSLQSEATRMWWMESLGWNFGNDSATKINNDKEREVSETPEWEAEAIIEETLGIQVPKLQYKPDKCIFSDYTYETVTNKAIVTYKIEEEYLMINMVSGVKNTTSSINYDAAIVWEDTIETSYGIVSMKELQSDNSNKSTVVAEWNYQDAHYEIVGGISAEDMKLVIENIIL